MQRFWFQLVSLGILLGLVIGCRTTQPELKPATQPQEINVPPSETRFDSPNYPKEVMVRDDKKARDTSFIPGKNGMGPGGGMGMNGMGGGGLR